MVQWVTASDLPYKQWNVESCCKEEKLCRTKTNRTNPEAFFLKRHLLQRIHFWWSLSFLVLARFSLSDQMWKLLLIQITSQSQFFFHLIVYVVWSEAGGRKWETFIIFTHLLCMLLWPYINGLKNKINCESVWKHTIL